MVSEALAGRDDRLTGYSIGLDVFDRPQNFDPAIDTIVRVEARRLRQSLQSYYTLDGSTDEIEITLPKGSYVPVFSPRQVENKGEGSDLQHKGPLIAVLPLENYSPDHSENYFANGLTEQLIASLTRFKDLSVISRTTASQFRGATVVDIRERLNVDYVFEGSIRKSSEALRVTAQLIDAHRDTHIWADTFDREVSAENLFAIQDDIAETLAARIADRYGPLGRIGGRRRSQTQSFDAYAAVLKFYDYYARHQPDLHVEARAALQQALVTDAAYTDAWAALAAIHLDEYRFNYNPIEDAQPPLDRAFEAALHAVLLDPDNAMAQQFLACAHFHAGARDEFRAAAERALALNPGHADVLADIGICLALIGDEDKGFALVDRAMELNPSHPGWYHTAAIAKHLVDGALEAALREAIAFYTPGFFWSHAWKATVLAKLGREEAAAQEVDLLLDVYPDFGRRFTDEVAKWQASDALIHALAQGLRLAGLSIVE
ncbi:MAG: hypothetical protein ACFB6S_07645 [Geminicoccaceae bacterium]